MVNICVFLEPNFPSRIIFSITRATLYFILIQLEYIFFNAQFVIFDQPLLTDFIISKHILEILPRINSVQFIHEI